MTNQYGMMSQLGRRNAVFVFVYFLPALASGNVITKCGDNSWVLVNETLCFKLTKPLSWDKASLECAKYGGSLIEDQEDWLNISTSYIHSYIGKTGEFYWTNSRFVTVMDDGKVWLFKDGSLMTYFNWEKGEPSASDEDEVHIHIKSSGKWNDEADTSNKWLFLRKYGAICENITDTTVSIIKVPNTNQKMAMYDESLHGSQAEAFCSERGGTLAKIMEQETQNIINERFMVNAKSNGYWIAGERKHLQSDMKSGFYWIKSKKLVASLSPSEDDALALQLDGNDQYTLTRWNSSSLYPGLCVSEPVVIPLSYSMNTERYNTSNNNSALISQSTLPSENQQDGDYLTTNLANNAGKGVSSLTPDKLSDNLVSESEAAGLTFVSLSGSTNQMLTDSTPRPLVSASINSEKNCSVTESCTNSDSTTAFSASISETMILSSSAPVKNNSDDGNATQASVEALSTTAPISHQSPLANKATDEADGIQKTDSELSSSTTRLTTGSTPNRQATTIEGSFSIVEKIKDGITEVKESDITTISDLVKLSFNTSPEVHGVTFEGSFSTVGILISSGDSSQSSNLSKLAIQATTTSIKSTSESTSSDGKIVEVSVENFITGSMHGQSTSSQKTEASSSAGLTDYLITEDSTVSKTRTPSKNSSSTFIAHTEDLKNDDENVEKTTYASDVFSLITTELQINQSAHSTSKHQSLQSTQSSIKESLLTSSKNTQLNESTTASSRPTQKSIGNVEIATSKFPSTILARNGLSEESLRNKTISTLLDNEGAKMMTRKVMVVAVATVSALIFIGLSIGIIFGVIRYRKRRAQIPDYSEEKAIYKKRFSYAIGKRKTLYYPSYYGDGGDLSVDNNNFSTFKRPENRKKHSIIEMEERSNGEPDIAEPDVCESGTSFQDAIKIPEVDYI